MLANILALFIGASALTAQDPAAAPESGPPQRTAIPAILTFGEHRGLVVARVNGRDVRLHDLLAHLEARYDPRIKRRWSDPDGARELQSAALPQLLYQYVDILCLRAEAKAKGLAIASVPARVDAMLEESFAVYLKKIRRLQKGRKLTATSIDYYRARHRREQGLGTEIHALLDLLIPPRYRTKDLKDFHFRHGDYFGGQVKIAHIFLQTRDPATGRLHPAAQRKATLATARDVLSRVRKDAGNFADLARKFSQDRVTAPRGGEINAWSYRINPRLPAPLVRAAWLLPNGGVSGIVESFYGIHIVRRLKSVQNRFILPGGKTWGRLSKMKSKIDQEAFLFAMRKRHQRELRL